MSTSVRDIKQARKESLFLKEISSAIHEVALDDPILIEALVNKVNLSPDGSICTVFFYTHKGEEYFNNILLNTLNQYKGPLRKLLANKIYGRRTPNLIFKFDKTFEKQQRIEHILDTIKEELEKDETKED
jgi:ribosome-binding factor A